MKIRFEGSTLLGVGVMSRNCVEAALEVASISYSPITLIASRRQVDSKLFGGGYAGGWTTESFAREVRSRSPKNILIARDHGGPWQSPKEANFTVNEAMSSAKSSFESDIDAGFDLLHIDTGFSLSSGMDGRGVSLDRTLELYEHAWAYADKRGRDIAFEIGTDEQSPIPSAPDVVDRALSGITEQLRKMRLPLPAFCVIQTGTSVRETSNVGGYENAISTNETRKFLRDLSNICLRNGVLLKQHNSDYLSNHVLSQLPQLGIHAANIAPEFGVIETRSFIGALEKWNQKNLLERFLDLSYSSGKWKKWLAIESKASDLDKAVIAGHYLFSDPQFIPIYTETKSVAQKRGYDIDRILIEALKNRMLEYRDCFSKNSNHDLGPEFGALQ